MSFDHRTKLAIVRNNVLSLIYKKAEKESLPSSLGRESVETRASVSPSLKGKKSGRTGRRKEEKDG